MLEFKQFLFEQTKEQEDNIKKTLSKLPKKHSDLIKTYKIKWQCDNVLIGDDGHVGIVNPMAKTITISAPYKYPREFTFLHELAHLVWEAFVAPFPKLVEKWEGIVKNTKNKMNQNAEELFCHAYANTYSSNKIVIHNHPEWEKFVKGLNI